MNISLTSDTALEGAAKAEAPWPALGAQIALEKLQEVGKGAS